jgi:hypothetical protein
MLNRLAALRWIALPFLLASYAAIAQGEPFMALGNGQDTCGDWSEHPRSNYGWQVDVAFVQGFITGQNYYIAEPASRSIGQTPGKRRLESTQIV